MLLRGHGFIFDVDFDVISRIKYKDLSVESPQKKLVAVEVLL
jgi:hypothetical protein